MLNRTDLPNTALKWGIAYLIGLLVILTVILLEAVGMTVFQHSIGLSSVLATLALCCGSLVGGFMFGLWQKKNGLMNGALIGLSLGITAVLIGCMRQSFHIGLSMLFHLSVAVLSGAIGGVVALEFLARRRHTFTK